MDNELRLPDSVYEHSVRLKQDSAPLPIHDAVERRAICLKFAIETRQPCRPDSRCLAASVAETAGAVIEAAAMYESYIRQGR